MLQFQSQYKEQRKYKSSLADHIPFNSFALGEFLIELPSFSKHIKDKLFKLLNLAKNFYEEAVRIGKDECILYEGDFDLKDACEGLSEVSFFLGEYRQRVLEYKYAEYARLDKERKQKNKEQKRLEEAKNDEADDNIADAAKEDDVEEEEDKWEENKQSNEAIEVYNFKKGAAHYLKATIATTQAQRVFLDEAQKLSVSGLTDAAKVPREVASELFEAS